MTKLMLSCENKTQGILTNLKGFNNAVESITLLTALERELYDTKSIAGYSIKAAIECKEPAYNIIEVAKDMIEDGWKELSVQLSDKILNFKK